MHRRFTARAQLGFALWSVAIFALSWGCTDESTCPEPTPGRETICVSRSGGQTGMEGSCLPGPEPEPFSAEDLRALVEGTHSTTLGYRPAHPELTMVTEEAMGLPLTVIVELAGDPRELEGCQPGIQQDVVVTLRFEEPALDVIIEERVYAFSRTFAVVQREIGGGFAAALGLPRGEVTFSLAFDANGLSGTIDPHDGCGIAVFPADSRCPDWPRIEIDLNAERDGFRPRDALPLVEALDDIPFQWAGGAATTLSLSLVESPEWACSDDWVMSFCPDTIGMPLSIRAVAADGSIDAVLPAELSVDVATEASASERTCGPTTAGTIDSLAVIASNAILGPEALGDAVVPAGGGAALVDLRVFSGANGEHAEADVIAATPRDPGLGAPLDSTIDPARVSCFEDPPRGARIE